MSNIIRYTNHKGAFVDFGEGALNYFQHGLLDYDWSYTERNGRVVAFSKPIQEKTFPVGIFADTEGEGIALRNKIYEITDVDILARKPGALTINGWEMPCYIRASTASMYWMSGRVAEFELTVISERPNWTRPKTVNYTQRTGKDKGNGFLNYPYNYPYNYARAWSTQRADNAALMPCDFILRIYGYTDEPSVAIGDNTYEVDVVVPNGSRLEINSRAQTIELIDSVGRVTNVYDARRLGKKGSGHYIFEKVPVGRSTILWDNNFAFDLVLFEERSVPEWVV